MRDLLVVAIWFLNFGISWLNAWGCGKTWVESKAAGGWPHFMNWMGAIMSAAGFTWCYLLLAAFVGSHVNIEHANHLRGPAITPHALTAMIQLGYLVVILPILGSGLAITVHSWGVFWRRRTIGNGAVAGWNTFADIYNTCNAIRYVPQATRGLKDFFGSDKEKGKGIVLLLVCTSAVAGILTTRAIIRATARSTAQQRAFEQTMRSA